MPLADFPASRRWRANWIWCDRAPARNAWVVFHRCFELAGGGSGARLFISADTRYRLWINGERVGDGPPQSQPYHQFYDERDVAGRLRAGTNRIAVLVHHQGIQAHARGGLLAELCDAHGDTILGSDGRWRCLPGQAWRPDTLQIRGNQQGPFQEHCDLRELPPGWPGAVEDGDWLEPEVLPGRPPTVAPWLVLLPRSIAFLAEEAVPVERLERVEECLDLATRHRPGDLTVSLSQAGREPDRARVEDPANLVAGAGDVLLGCSTDHRDRVADGRWDPCLTLDLGRVVTAFVELEATAGQDGCTVEIGYAERLVDGHFTNAIEGFFADCAVLPAGRRVGFRPLVWRSFRYLRLRVKHADEPLVLHALRVLRVRYPYTERGRFASGDHLLDGAWEISRETVRLCSNEALMDTPQREQAQWLGDVAAVTVPAIHACFGDAALPGKFLRQAAANTQPTGLIANISNVVPRGWERDIPDYSLWWVCALRDQYRFTGEERWVHECWPEACRVLRVHLDRVAADGLVEDMPGWVFIDWANVQKEDRCAAYNAVFALALDAWGELAAVKGDAWLGERIAATRDRLGESFQPAFLEPERGVLVDAVIDGERRHRVSEHANAAAILAGLLGPATVEEVVRHLWVERDVEAVEAQPFFCMVVLRALAAAGHRDLALDLVRERWGGRVVERGRTSCTEEWYENGSWRDGHFHGFMRTHSHAWSAAPADFLVRGLAGVEILEPGCGRLRIDPYLGLDYEVLFPTPLGEVAVRVADGEAAVELPAGIERA